jgi:hypothetical protein
MKDASGAAAASGSSDLSWTRSWPIAGATARATVPVASAGRIIRGFTYIKITWSLDIAASSATMFNIATILFLVLVLRKSSSADCPVGELNSESQIPKISTQPTPAL